MRPTFYLKQGDTSPSLVYFVLPKSIDFTGASVVFSMKEAGTGTSKINRASAFVQTPTGEPALRYDWQPSNVDVIGNFEADFEVTYSNGKKEHFPNKDFIDIVIGAKAG